MPKQRSNNSPPIDIDENDGVIKDPTINVQNLLQAAVIRQNDLRDAEIRRIDERHLIETAHLELRITEEAHHTSEVMALRSNYEHQLAEAEAKRIDAIRVVDVNAVNVANERAVAQAAVLANAVATSADTLRGLVATTASTVAQQLQAVTAQLSDRLTVLERSNNIGQGREQYVDPLMTSMVSEIKALTTSIVESKGKTIPTDPILVALVADVKVLATAVTESKAFKGGVSSLWGWFAGALGVIYLIMNILSKSGIGVLP